MKGAQKMGADDEWGHVYLICASPVLVQLAAPSSYSVSSGCGLIICRVTRCW